MSKLRYTVSNGAFVPRDSLPARPLGFGNFRWCVRCAAWVAPKLFRTHACKP